MKKVASLKNVLKMSPSPGPNAGGEDAENNNKMNGSNRHSFNSLTVAAEINANGDGAATANGAANGGANGYVESDGSGTPTAPPKMCKKVSGSHSHLPRTLSNMFQKNTAEVASSLRGTLKKRKDKGVSILSSVNDFP